MDTSPLDRVYAALRAARPEAPLATITALLAGVAVLAAMFALKNIGVSQELLLSVYAATVLVGGLAGFLFGLPRFSYASGAAPAVPAATNAASAAGAGQQQPALPANRNAAGEYTPSTNLDEIANWLTKIIIGATLVEIKNVGHAVSDIAAYVVASSGPEPTPSGQPFVASLIVFAFVGGFLFG